ncbi:DUF771 domain-containing protein [Lactobacillus jensenii]|uniref:DUF771 domain-containing protein n=1 Tax=Lactobacillus jensenii TaxID=109790 RepID=A0A5N1IKP3_LACJE|nr:DUF771 domain-containing protein [Lactobacillus jensenii]KAA9324457.1 DUF771 domain-containing protein [Lactobacillus jensenii]
MGLINEGLLEEMIKQVMKEQRVELEEDLTGRTVDINYFRKNYCGNKSCEWVRTFIFDKFPETDFYNGGWVVNPRRGSAKAGRKTIIFLKPASEWLEKNKTRINWNASLSS